MTANFTYGGQHPDRRADRWPVAGAAVDDTLEPRRVVRPEAQPAPRQEDPVRVHQRRARVLISDPSPTFRALYRALVRKHASVAEIGGVASVAEALALMAGASWDVVVINVLSHDRRTYALIQRVQLSHPDIKVLLITGREAGARYVLGLHAHGYLPNYFSGEELMLALSRVLAGHRYTSPEVMAALRGRPAR